MIFQILITFLLFFGFIGIIALSEYIYKRFNFPAEVTRKGAHLTATLSSLIIVIFIESHWYILGLGIFFFTLLFIGRKLGVFNSIDAVNRKTGGSYLLPISIYTAFLVAELLNQTLYFVLPVLLLAICDSLAGFAGIRYKKKTTNISIFSLDLEKTYLGSGVFFLSSFLISGTVLYFYQYTGFHWILWTLIIALFTTLIEMLSSRGLDNLTIPWMTILLIWLSTIT